MKQRTKRKLRAGVITILKMLDKYSDWLMVPSKSESYRRLKQGFNFDIGNEFWKEYYASSIKDGVERLLRKGRVEMREVDGKLEVRITDKGKMEIIREKLDELGIAKPSKWDGKWRMVFFDVDELNKIRRDRLSRWLKKLGLRRMQRSVYVYPYPLEREISFLREVLGVPHGVKLVTAERIENEEDLREMFDL
ncbi:MAG: Transcriptional regulator, PaaX family [Candidatus Amesbacteria bacterium GW2011_GWA2_47_70]|nr:MAG: Transcriptional regulator, PaaX family [Candidatus Amesbacteria bacterium GW2011_GWA2_47_70]